MSNKLSLNKEEIIVSKSEELVNNNKPRFPFNKGRNRKRLQLTNSQSTGNFKKNLIIRPAYGLGNRLRAIASCYSICKSLGLNLIINWVSDHHCNCNMYDLFDEIGTFGYVVNEEIIIENLEKEGYKFYNYIETEPNGKKDQFIDFENETEVFIKSNCSINSKYSSRYYIDFFKNVKFNNYVNELINSIDTKNCIGMHIRMGGGKEFCSESYDNSKNWTAEEAKLIFQNREKSHIDYFIDQIDNILNNDPSQQIYIATDLEENYKILIDLYGEENIKFLKRKVYDRSAEQIKFALTDMILLSKCKSFYGSSYSSFSEMVVAFQCKFNNKINNIFSNSFPNNKITKTVERLYTLNNEQLKDVSIVTSSMNRHSNIILSLYNWLSFDNITEIIIVDWCSDKMLEDLMPTNLKLNPNYRKIKIITVRNYNKWVLSYAFNLGFYHCTKNIVLKLDSEISLSLDFFDKNYIKNNEYAHGTWKDVSSFNGQFLCFKNNLNEIKWFNQRIVTYGWDDSDLYERMNKICKEKTIDPSTLFHVDGNDSISYQDINNKNIEIQYNRNLVKNGEFHEFNINDFTKLTGLNYHLNKPIIYKRNNELYKKTLVNILAEKKFGGYSELQKYDIDKLLNIYSNGNTINNKTVVNKKTIYFKCLNGIGNRIRNISNFYSFALKYDYELIIIWDGCKGFEFKPFENLFDTTELRMSIVRNIDLDDIKPDYILDKVDILKQCKFVEAKKIYIDTAHYITKFVFADIEYNIIDYNFMKLLKPSVSVRNTIQYVKKMNNIKHFKDFSCVHVRRGDATEINYKYRSQYLKSSLYKFAYYINTSFEKNGKKVLVFTDDTFICQYYFNILCKNRYIILSDVKELDSIASCVDLFIMSKCNTIYANNWSSFSALASKINGAKLLTVIDENKFGLFSYNNSVNIGDIIQSIAVRQYLPYYNCFIDRDSLTSVNENMNIVMGGWFAHTKNCLKIDENKKMIWCCCDNCDYNDINWPPNTNVKPLFFSFNISNNKLLDNPKNIEYLKKHEPIGCRDLGTVIKLNNHGIENYFSGCLTLILEPRGFEKENFILVIDANVPDEYKNEKIKRCKNTINLSTLKYSNEEQLLQIGLDTLEQIEKAKLVITSRLHVMAPCLAFGTKVIFKPNEKANGNISLHNNASFHSDRYKGIEDFLDKPEEFKVFQQNMKENIIKEIYAKYYK